MPVNTAAALITNAYRGQLLTLRETTALATAGLLDSINLNSRPAQLAADLAAFRLKARNTLQNAQLASGLLTLQYLLAYMTSSGSALDTTDVEPPEPDADPLTVVRGALLWRLSQGKGHAVAIGTATAVAQRVARTSVQSTAVSTLATGIDRSPNITGYRRVTGSSCCKRCANAARSGEYGSDSDFYQHPADRCTQEPVVAGLAETVLRSAAQVVSP